MSIRVQRQLPFAVLGTMLVVVAPALAATLLPGGPLVAIPACVALSLALGAAVGALWRRFPQSRDILFSDLMLWGWLRRLRTERRLEHVESFVRNPGGPVEAVRALRGMQRVTRMLESRDAYTHRHSHRVTRHCEGIARELGLPDEEIARITTAAALHDIGKFFTPREVLNKPGRLTDEEFGIVKRHPGDGADLVKGIVEPEVVAMIRHHHERMGGTGYPDGLAGDAIPLGARIIAVADTFDAMTSTRAYRTARPHARALRVLREEAGTALDAQVVAAFLAYYSGRRGLRWSGLASSFPLAVAPLRELVLSGGRALPALGASAAVLAAPAVSAAPPASVASARAHHAAKQTAHREAVITARLSARPQTNEDGSGGRATSRHTARRRDGVPQATHTPGRRPGGSGLAPGRPGGGAATPGGGQSGGTGSGSGASPSPTSAPADAPAGTTPVPTSAPAVDPTAAVPDPPVSTPAPSPPPEVQVDPVTVPVGGGQVQTPPIQVDLPDLPIPLPPIHLP